MTADVRLFSLASLVTATVVGSMAAGVWLLYMNYVALGKPDLAKKTLKIGSLIFGTLVLISTQLPSGNLLLGLMMMLLQTVMVYGVARLLQGATIDYHRTRGGAMHSPFLALGLGFVVALLMLILLVVLGTLLAPLASRA